MVSHLLEDGHHRGLTPHPKTTEAEDVLQRFQTERPELWGAGLTEPND
jgi:hypothetical protein